MARSCLLLPPNVRVSNRDCSSNSSCTKSENMIWRSSRSGDQTVIDNFNDHNAGNVLWNILLARQRRDLDAAPASSVRHRHGPNFGDPIVVFNQKLDKWFAGDLATRLRRPGYRPVELTVTVSPGRW